METETPTPNAQPVPTDASSEPSSRDEAPSETNEDTHEQVQAELRALLEEVQKSFLPFEQTIFTKIDAMQDKINELDNSVANLSETTKQTHPASADHAAPSHGTQQPTSEFSSAIQP